MTRDEYLPMAALFAPRGTDLPQSRLTPDQVVEIRENRRGMTAWQQAEKYGVHIRTIEKVRRYETWTHVK